MYRPGNFSELPEVVKNLLIIIVTISYLYFYFFLGKSVKSVEILQKNLKNYDEVDRIDSLCYFLTDEEINKKF